MMQAQQAVELRFDGGELVLLLLLRALIGYGSSSSAIPETISYRSDSGSSGSSGGPQQRWSRMVSTTTATTATTTAKAAAGGAEDAVLAQAAAAVARAGGLTAQAANLSVRAVLAGAHRFHLLRAAAGVVVHFCCCYWFVVCARAANRAEKGKKGKRK